MEENKYKLLGSLLLFTQVFYKLRTGREFVVDEPVGRESHLITISKALTKTQRGDDSRLIINVPPRYGKTELCIHYVAWCLARYPQSNFLYVSYSHTLAAKQTQTIREIVEHPLYKKLFGVELSMATRAKDNFETTAGGSVYAAGAGGTITGRGAGIQNCEEYGGAIIIDDIHKPSEVASDTMRSSINEWYLNTLQSRINSPGRTPIIFIGQRLHEEDLGAKLINGYDGYQWPSVILKALDEAGNAICPRMHTAEQLKVMEKSMPYEFAAQYQQNPMPAGGALFKPEDFVILDETPKNIVSTFITVDTAETEKTYNDATVFSFWGLYKIQECDHETDVWGLHWIDCSELWIEPKDLVTEFMGFYRSCLRFPIKPNLAGIEKKSTGTTLISQIKDMRGLQIYEFQPTREQGSKGDRFIAAQGYVASKRISFNTFDKHTKPCIDHMKKITPNNSHRYDDIADTCSLAIRMAFIDDTLRYTYTPESEDEEKVSLRIAAFNSRLHKTGRANYHGQLS